MGRATGPQGHQGSGAHPFLLKHLIQNYELVWFWKCFWNCFRASSLNSWTIPKVFVQKGGWSKMGGPWAPWALGPFAHLMVAHLRNATPTMSIWFRPIWGFMSSWIWEFMSSWFGSLFEPDSESLCANFGTFLRWILTFRFIPICH